MVAPRSVSSGDSLDDAFARVAGGVFVREADEKDLSGTDVPRARARVGARDARARAIDRCALERGFVCGRATANASARDENWGWERKMRPERDRDPLRAVVLRERMRA
jgi:hypothetical protein